MKNSDSDSDTVNLSPSEKKMVVKVLTLNMLLHSGTAKEHEKSARKNEAYIVSNQKFLAAVSEARKALGLNANERVDETDIDSWIVERLSKGSVSKHSDNAYFDYLRQFQSVVVNALNQAGLDDNWNSYMSIYIINQEPPKSPVFVGSEFIEVQEVSQDNEITLTLRPGLRYEDYRHAWSAITRFLGPGMRLAKPYTDKDKHDRILIDKQTLTYRQLAEKYYPSQAAKDIEKAIIRVKTIVRRKRKIQKG